jgi:hypothetical protein
MHDRGHVDGEGYVSEGEQHTGVTLEATGRLRRGHVCRSCSAAAV